MIMKQKKESDLQNNFEPKSQPRIATNSVPSLRSLVGIALPKIGAYKNLDNKTQVVAVINDVSIFIIGTLLYVLVYKFLIGPCAKCCLK